jgi:hypothetical protein
MYAEQNDENEQMCHNNIQLGHIHVFIEDRV